MVASLFVHAAVDPVSTLELRVSLLGLGVEILGLFILAAVHPVSTLAVIFLGPGIKILCSLVHAAKVSELAASVVLFR